MERHGPWLIFIVALLVRAGYLLQMSRSPWWRVLMGDAVMFDNWAQQIAGGDWFGHDVFFQVPFYPYFLAVLYKIFGHSIVAVRIVQIFLGAASCSLLVLAGRRFFSARIGLAAGVVLAFYPAAIFFDALIQKASLDLFFMTLLLFFAASMDIRMAAWKALLAGLVLSCFALTRENSLIFLPLLSLWMFVRFREELFSRRIRWMALFIAGASTLLLLAGWHNKVCGGKFQPTTAAVGVNFYYGNGAQTDGRYVPLGLWRGDAEFERSDQIEIPQRWAGRKLTMAEISQYWWDKAFADIRANPGRWVRLMVRKWFLVWNAAELMDTESILLCREYSSILRMFGFLNFGVICPLAALGLWLTRDQWRRYWFFYFFLLGFAASIALFLVSARYRFPMVPVLILFAAAAVFKVTEIYRARKFSSLARAAVIFVIATVAVNWPLVNGKEDLAAAHSNLGIALFKQSNLRSALEQFECALDIRPGWTAAANNLAWIYATHPDPALRNGPRALQLAIEAARATGFKDASTLDTLAAAYAEAGNFDEAIKIAEQILVLAEAASDTARLEKTKPRLQSYRQHQPWRDSL